MMISNNVFFDHGTIKNYIKGGTFKFEDLETIKNKALMDMKEFEYWKIEITKKLITQCQDKRLIDFGDGIKESNVKNYLEKGYITPEIALECYSVLPLEMKDLSNKK